MFNNVGSFETKLRLIAGFTLMVLGFALPLAGQWPLAIISMGVISLFTATFGFCPLKAILLRSTGTAS